MESLFKRYNPNPKHVRVGDCTVRALSNALGQTWHQTFSGLFLYGYEMCDMPSSDAVWGAYLRSKGFTRRVIPTEYDMTVSDFAKSNGSGIYIVCPVSHVICVRDGRYYDTWDSGDEIPIYYWEKENE